MNILKKEEKEKEIQVKRSNLPGKWIKYSRKNISWRRKLGRRQYPWRKKKKQ